MSLHILLYKYNRSMLYSPILASDGSKIGRGNLVARERFQVVTVISEIYIQYFYAVEVQRVTGWMLAIFHPNLPFTC